MFRYSVVIVSVRDAAGSVEWLGSVTSSIRNLNRRKCHGYLLDPAWLIQKFDEIERNQTKRN